MEFESQSLNFIPQIFFSTACDSNCHQNENNEQHLGDLKVVGLLNAQLQSLETQNWEDGAGKQADIAHSLLESRR